MFTRILGLLIRLLIQSLLEWLFENGPFDW